MWVVGERSLRRQGVDGRAVEHTPDASGVVGPGQGQCFIVRALIGDHLVASGVVGLDEHRVTGTLAEPRAGRSPRDSGSPGRQRCNDGGQSECDPGTNGQVLDLVRGGSFWLVGLTSKYRARNVIAVTPVASPAHPSSIRPARRRGGCSDASPDRGSHHDGRRDGSTSSRSGTIPGPDTQASRLTGTSRAAEGPSASIRC